MQKTSILLFLVPAVLSCVNNWNITRISVRMSAPVCVCVFVYICFDFVNGHGKIADLQLIYLNKVPSQVNLFIA